MRIKHFLKKFVRDEEGATAVEYAVMIVLIVIVCLLTVQYLGSQVEVGFNNIATGINDAAK